MVPFDPLDPTDLYQSCHISQGFPTNFPIFYENLDIHMYSKLSVEACANHSNPVPPALKRALNQILFDILALNMQ